MDWDDLRIFLAVARAESLSGAGRRLGMDASTIGRRIARLEGAVGAALFAKTPQGYALTAEGARLVAPAEAAEQSSARCPMCCRQPTPDAESPATTAAPGRMDSHLDT